jgi:hypothetical protein
MGDISHEPSMEDILSSIKRIIADDAEKALSEPRSRRPALRPAEVEERPAVVLAPPAAAAPVEGEAEDIFELTEPAPEEPLVSETVAQASRSALESLSTLIVKPEVSGSDTLEGLVKDMLRPMLKDWLDANLPNMVEALVAKEIARITGKSLV